MPAPVHPEPDSLDPLLELASLLDALEMQRAGELDIPDLGSYLVSQLDSFGEITFSRAADALRNAAA